MKVSQPPALVNVSNAGDVCGVNNVHQQCVHFPLVHPAQAQLNWVSQFGWIWIDLDRFDFQAFVTADVDDLFVSVPPEVLLVDMAGECRSGSYKSFRSNLSEFQI